MQKVQTFSMDVHARSFTVHVIQLLFISGNFSFSFVSTLLAYITIPKNERKPKLTESEIKKLTTTYTLSFYFKFKSIMLLPFLEMAYTEHMDSN